MRIVEDKGKLTKDHCARCGGDRKHHRHHFTRTSAKAGAHRFVAAIKR